MSSIRHVREGSTGILSITTDAREKTFLPDCDMDAARALLLEFQELRDIHGSALKDNYHLGDRNWYPAMVSYLYWHFFLQFVKYRPLVEDWMAGRKRFAFTGHSRLGTLLGLLDEDQRVDGIGDRLHDLLWRAANWITVRRHKAEVLFFRFAMRDFRSTEIRKTLDSLAVRYLEAVPAQSFNDIMKNILRGGRHYFYAQPPKPTHGDRFRHEYRLDHLDSVKRRLFEAAIRLTGTTLTACEMATTTHTAAIRRSGVRVFYGFDDVNTYFFPVFFACRALGLATIGHQHGAYVKRHAGYMMEGLKREDVQWFDRVIVWGSYWREKMLRDAPIHPPERWVIGANKLKIPYSPTDSAVVARIPASVLIPYEFLASTAKVGGYIKRLIGLGYTVWFRARADEPLDAQLDAYQLPPETRTLVQLAIGPLDSEFLAGIDIVAGTMTTLIYELLPAGKIVWYLDTECRHLLDLVDEGLAHHIRLDDLRPPGQMPPETLTPTRVPAEELFGSESLEDSLRRHVLA